MCENNAYTSTLFLCLHTGGDVKRFNYKTLKRGSVPPKKVGIRFRGRSSRPPVLRNLQALPLLPKKWRIVGLCCQILKIFLSLLMHWNTSAWSAKFRPFSNAK